MSDIRTDWTRNEVHSLYHTPLMELIFQGARVHREHHETGEVQVCTLLSIKTGACPEDCAYCPQSARYNTGLETEPLLATDEVLAAARSAKESGSTRFCMGAAWRCAKDGKEFDHVLDLVRGVADLGLEVCCTLGMLTDEQARKLKDAGLYAYNHNLDSSEAFYDRIISTRTYEDRLETLGHVRDNDISVCCGGILGMGETHDDRVDLLHTLATQPEHPESVPVNALIAVKGTPLGDQPKVPSWDMARMIATARILMPRAMVRLSAGRVEMTLEQQALCFMAGANSIFMGDKLLTTGNNELDDDRRMFEVLGLKPRPAYKNASAHQIPVGAS
ncbi:MAG: biotin synthase BioB [Gemmatimonadota bacterium]|nr:biotin synthase BioB [Gemmatimonadota bacterium]